MIVIGRFDGIDIKDRKVSINMSKKWGLIYVLMIFVKLMVFLGVWVWDGLYFWVMSLCCGLSWYMLVIIMLCYLLGLVYRLWV